MPRWPIEYGGKGWDRIKRNIFDDDLSQVPTPELAGGGADSVGPVIYTFGNEAQKSDYLLGRITQDPGRSA